MTRLERALAAGCFKGRPLSDAQRAYIAWAESEPPGDLSHFHVVVEYLGFLSGYAAAISEIAERAHG